VHRKAFFELFTAVTFHKQVLDIDPPAETERIVKTMRDGVRKVMRRQGCVVGISGGVDSSVALGLCVRAFGPDRVIAIMMPDQDSNPDSEALAQRVAAHYGVTPILENITAALQGFACYPRHDDAIRRVVPEYEASLGYKAKIVLP